jgi:DNA polymerase III subunit epsilon
MASAYCTLLNPQRAVPRRPWISPGLTTSTLAGAPAITDIEPEGSGPWR